MLNVSAKTLAALAISLMSVSSCNKEHSADATPLFVPGHPIVFGCGGTLPTQAVKIYVNMDKIINLNADANSCSDCVKSVGYTHKDGFDDDDGGPELPIPNLGLGPWPTPLDLDMTAFKSWKGCVNSCAPILVEIILDDKRLHFARQNNYSSKYAMRTEKKNDKMFSCLQSISTDGQGREILRFRANHLPMSPQSAIHSLNIGVMVNDLKTKLYSVLIYIDPQMKNDG